MVFITVIYALILLYLPVTIDSTYVPTLVNGITTSMSIIVGLGGAVIGIVFRGDIEKGDSQARKAYFFAIGLFILTFIYPWGSYLALATNLFEFALRYSLDGYLVAVLAIFIVYFLMARRWDLEEGEKSKKTESDKIADPIKNMPKLTYRSVGKFLVCALLIFLVGTLLIFAIVNVFDIHVDFLNPPLPTKSLFMNVDYFVNNTGDFVLPSFGNGVANALLVHIELNLTTQGALVEDQIVTIDAQGSVSDSFANSLFIRGEYKPVYVLFIGANNVIGNLTLRPIYGDIFGMVGLAPTYSNVSAWTIGSLHLEGGNQTQIKWSSQGDYYPILLIPTSGEPQLTPYPNKTIHIYSSEVLANSRYNRINEVLTIVLTTFATIEVGKLIYESFFKKN